MSELIAEFDCTVVGLNFTAGDPVASGEVILCIECMKMLVSMYAPCAGLVRYLVTPGDTVSAGHILARIDQS